MKEGVKNKKQLYKKWLDKYKIVILNEDTFEEKYAVKLTRLNAFIFISASSIILILFTTILIALTPLREYIPGYSSTQLKRQATELTYKTDSLVNALNYTNRYLDNVRMVLRGDIENTEVNRDSLFEQFKLDLNLNLLMWS